MQGSSYSYSESSEVGYSGGFIQAPGLANPAGSYSVELVGGARGLAAPAGAYIESSGASAGNYSIELVGGARGLAAGGFSSGSAGGFSSGSAGGFSSGSAGGFSSGSAGGFSSGSAGGFSYESSSSASAGYASGASAGFSSGASSSVFLSQIEMAILRSNIPIDITETEEITVQGQRGIWANKSEVVSWRGPINISEYLINEDSNPEIINKKVSQSIEYIQELAIRYLRPPTPPAPGEIIIKQEANISIPPAPPLIIRQQPPRPPTPEPLVIREAPPQAPAQVGRKLITISGKRIPPPPRKVIIERLPAIPGKPQSVLIERWLPYAQQKRKVIYQGNSSVDPVVVKPRNVIVQWESPSVSIKKEIKYLGTINANPAEYISRYGASLKTSRDLPQYVLDIATPDGLVLAANYQYNNIHELEGELKALGLIDLDREGLGQYRAQLLRFGIALNVGGSSSSASYGGSSGLIVSGGSGSASYGGSSGLIVSGGSGSASYGGSSGLIVSGGSGSASYGGSSGLIVSGGSLGSASYGASSGLIISGGSVSNEFQTLY